MSAKLATLKIKVFWNKGYDAITSAHDITNKILLRDLNFIVYALIRPKFGNSSIFIRELFY